MKDLIVDCSNCKQPVRMVKEGNRIVWYSESESFGPHGCDVVKNGRRFLSLSGWFSCRDCGDMVTIVTMSDGKKWALAIDKQRHRCSERLKPIEERFWSKDGSYPWEYPVIDGVPTYIVKESYTKR